MSDSNLILKTENEDFGEVNDENVKIIDTKTNEVKNKSFFENVKNFIIRKKEYFIALGIYSFLFLLFLAIGGVFSDKNTILLGDSYEQIGVFFEHIFDVLSGKSSLFYSSVYGKGFEIFSTIQYMFTNPFYIVVLFGGRNHIYQMFGFAIYLMLAFNLVTFIWFTNKYLKNLNNWTRILFSLLYVFSGYANFCFAFVTWFVYPSLILIVVDRFIEFVKTGKTLWFILFFVWHVVACYSVGISTAIILFVLFVTYILMVVPKENRFEKLTGLFVVFVITALSSIVIIFPSIMAVLGTGRSDSFLYSLMFVKNTKLANKVAIIFSGLAVLVLALIYFVKCNKKEKLNKFFLFAFVILFLPMFFDSMLRLLCLSKYQGFPGRFYFINEALIFFLAMSVIDKKLIKFKTCESEKIFKILFFFISSILILVILLINIFARETLGTNIKTPVTPSSGLSIYVLTFCVLGLLLVAVLLLNNFKKLSEKFSKISICILLVLSLSVNFMLFSSCSGGDDSSRTELSQLLSSCKNETGFAKSFGANVDADLMNLRSDGIRKVGVFSSLIPGNAIDIYEYFGYLTSSTVYLDDCGSLISDAMFGMKFYISDRAVDRPYLELVSKSENYYLYKNTLATNGVFSISSEFSFDEELNSVENLEKLAKFYGISGNLFEEPNLENVEISNDEINLDAIDVDFDKVKKYTFTASNTGILYVGGRFCFYTEEKSPLIGIDGICLENYDETTIEDMVFLNAGESYTFYIDEKNVKEADEISFTFLNYEPAKQLCEKLQENEINYEITKNGYKVNGTAPENSKVYIMNPKINGMSYSLNGEQMTEELLLGGIVVFDASGDFEVVANYKYPYLKLWLVAFVVVALLVCIFAIFYNKTKFKHTQKAIGYAMISVLCIIGLIVYVFGFLASIINFCL